MRSFGSMIAGCSERSAPVRPPSTSSGPRILVSRCGSTGNGFVFVRKNGIVKFGSALSSIVCGT